MSQGFPVLPNPTAPPYIPSFVQVTLVAAETLA